MSREVLNEQKIQEAFDDYQTGTNIEDIAKKNFVTSRSLYRYFARRGMKKHKLVKVPNKSVSDKHKML